MTPAVTLRTAVPADADAVRALTRAAYAKWVAVTGREPLPMRADHARAVREHRVDLLLVGGALVALIEMVPRADGLLVENVAVDPTRQGEGHGKRLLAHAEAVAAGLSLPVVRLYTNKLFAANLSFYAGLGYAVEREEALNGGTAVHMAKPVGVRRGGD
jgi:GNAT superfamily N-acetyltransferase